MATQLEHPQIGPLLMVAALGAIGLLLTAAVWHQLRRGRSWRNRLLWGAAGVAAFYAMILFGVGIASKPVKLEVGAEKYFCELDCHLAYRVTGLHSLSRAGSTENGRLWAVTLTARFDSATISPTRSRTTPTFPGPRLVRLTDQQGRTHEAVTGSQMSELTRPLVPGEVAGITLVFELPAGVEPATLWLGDAILANRFMIGHERSPYHGKVVFALPHT